MDLGFLSNIFGGQKKEGNNMLNALLPLLLGGKNASFGEVDSRDILSNVLKGNFRDKGESFPPLFGDNKEGNSLGGSNLLNLLGNITKQSSPPQQEAASKSQYPYELQYNRPDRS